MERIALLASSIVGVALLVWSFTTSGKEGTFMLFLGAAYLFCTLAVFGLRCLPWSKGKTPATNYFALVGALVGLFLGGYVGARFGFGRVMIAIFNPGLPERDYGSMFGAIGGGILGALLLATLCGTLDILFTGRKEAEPVEESPQPLPNSPDDIG